MKDFELLPHTADIKMRVYGNNLQELFKNALAGMFQSIRPQIDGCRLVNDRIVCDILPCERQVDVQSCDQEVLLVDFLSQALVLGDIHDEVYFDVSFASLTAQELSGVIKGVPITGYDVVEIKAVTYHDLEIKQIDGTWQADVVFDI